MAGGIAKFFTGAAVSAARSLLLSEVKGSVKSFINDKRAKTLDDIRAEMLQKIGYLTSHYVVNKKTQEVIYKPSAIFMHEWLANSPLVKEKIIRDEESGQIYIDGEVIDGAKKLDLVERFVNATGIKNAGLMSNLDNAFKMLPLTDVNANKFADHFSGWDKNHTSVIDSFIQNAFGPILETDAEYSRKLFRKWIIGTARRAIKPGTTFDGCLVFTGPQGTGKTALFRNLLPEPFNNRTGEIYCNVKNPVKFVESVKGKTIANFDELSILEYARSLETFKQLLSSQFIDVRLAWRRDPQRYALRQGFSGTTNRARFITDPALSRRLWVLELNNVGRLNFDYLFANRTSLWQEAVSLASTEESCLLSVDEQRVVEEHNKKYLVG